MTGPIHEEEAKANRKGPYSEPGFMRQFEPSIELAHYYLRTKQIDKADTYFAELQKKAFGKPAFVIWLGEIGTAIVLSEKGDVERSNDLFLQLARRAAFTVGTRERSPRSLMHHPSIKPYVVEALDRNGKKGDLPPGLQQMWRKLDP